MKNTIAIIFATLAGFLFTGLIFIMADDAGYDPILISLILAGPVVLLFAIACIRNGANFTLIWSAILFAMGVGILMSMYMEFAGLTLLCVVPLFVAGIIIHALAYHPELGAFGAIIDKARSWRSGGLMPTANSVMDKAKNAGKFGTDVQLALLIIIGLQILNISMNLTA